MAIRNPTFNLKTGAESDLIVSREETSGTSIGKIKRNDGLFRFPYLTRRTGDTLTGSTENIESNELRHGRKKSAPRKGTSSSSGDINFEFSSETFDEMMEAAFRGKWRRWKNDTDSPSNIANDEFADGYFATTLTDGSKGSKKLLAADGTGLIQVLNPDDFVVHELNSETENIKYSMLRKYGGQPGEDLWQEFTHVAINTMQLNVAINEIITGSFGIMGTNNPKLLDTNEVLKNFESRLESISNNDNLVDRGVFKTTETYAVGDMVVYEGDGDCYKCTTAVTVAGTWTGSTNWTKLESYEYIESIPDHATDTLQFTAREGFLYINGKQIEFAQSLSFTLDNGLTQKFAIFVPNAISTEPLELNINGDLSTYVVGGESEAKKMFNDAVDDKNVELLWCFQNKLEDPTALYVFQVFTAKHTENSINGNGSDTFDESLPWQSFGEQACRVFKVLLPRFTDAVPADIGSAGYANAVMLIPNTLLEGVDDIPLYDASTAPNGIKLSFTVDGSAEAFTPKAGVRTGTEANPTLSPNDANVYLDLVTDSDTYGEIVVIHGITQGVADKTVDLTAEWNGEQLKASFKINHS